MRRLTFAMLLCAGAAFLPSSATAEVLRISGYRAPATDAVQTIETLSVGRFTGGQDGRALAFALEEQLASRTVDGMPYFNMVAAETGAPSDAMLSGSTTVTVNEYDVEETRNICVERDDKDKCLRKADRPIDCIRREHIVETKVRLAMMGDGRIAWSDRFEKRADVVDCPDRDYDESEENVIRRLIEDSAGSISSALVPRAYDDMIRVLENRKKLSKAHQAAFKSALKLTKSDVPAACALWDQISIEASNHAESWFNAGLCAEARGYWAHARDLYREAAALKPKESAIRTAIKRVTETEMTRAAIDARWSWIEGRH
jgi:hypothetical protein